jgi:hypothetical protein
MILLRLDIETRTSIIIKIVSIFFSQIANMCTRYERVLLQSKSDYREDLSFRAHNETDWSSFTVTAQTFKSFSRCQRSN